VGLQCNTSIIKVSDVWVSFDLRCYFMDGKGEEGWAEGVALLHTSGRIHTEVSVKKGCF